MLTNIVLGVIYIVIHVTQRKVKGFHGIVYMKPSSCSKWSNSDGALSAVRRSVMNKIGIVFQYVVMFF